MHVIVYLLVNLQRIEVDIDVLEYVVRDVCLRYCMSLFYVLT